MKITAHFYSPDEADRAASAVRRLGDGIFDVTVTERETGAHRDRGFAAVGVFTGMNTGSAQPVPISVGDNDPPAGKTADLEVICRPSEAHRVTSALVSRGGYEIRNI